MAVSGATFAAPGGNVPSGFLGKLQNSLYKYKKI